MGRMRSNNGTWRYPGITIAKFATQIWHLLPSIAIWVVVIIVMTGIFFIFTPQTATAVLNAEILNSQTGIASYYSYECADQPMANGRIFDPEDRTCASWFHKFGTVLVVKSLDTGRSTEVVVTDRGPNKRLVREGRIIDLSERAFEDICDLDKGLTRVEVRIKGV